MVSPSPLLGSRNYTALSNIVVDNSTYHYSLILQFQFYSVMHFLTLLFTALPAAFAQRYSLEDEIIGERFFHAFSHEAIDDPTHGRVE